MAEFFKYDILRIEAVIVKAYSKKPVDYAELNEYLLLGGFSAKERSRIGSSVAKITGIAPATGVFPQPPKDEKK